MKKHLASSWILVPCEHCDGEGYTEEAIPGGYFDMKQACWYPHSKVVICSVCHGDGHISVCYDAEAPEIYYEDAA